MNTKHNNFATPFGLGEVAFSIAVTAHLALVAYALRALGVFSVPPTPFEWVVGLSLTGVAVVLGAVHVLARSRRAERDAVAEFDGRELVEAAN